jgi:hypothetical protein
MGRPGLSRHPKFLRLALELGNEPLARGALELLWEVSYEAGDPRIGDPANVEAAARWRGEKGALFAALRDAGGTGRVGFIEDRDGAWVIHDLWDHAPDYVRKRAAREDERRVKGRSMDAARTTLTGQSPVTDRALTPPPAPTRAPSPAPEKKKKLAGPAPADPREGGDATYRALVERLFALFLEKRGVAYDPQTQGTRDWKALGNLRKRHDAAEIIRRWGIGLSASYKARCDTFVDLEARWNALTAPEAQGGAQGPQKRPDPNGGIITHVDPLDDPAALAEATRRQEVWLNGK